VYSLGGRDSHDPPTDHQYVGSEVQLAQAVVEYGLLVDLELVPPESVTRPKHRPILAPWAVQDHGGANESVDFAGARDH
jgi:hypothetical protein